MTSDEFKKIRESLVITQGRLALIMGTHQPNIARIESGKRQPTEQQAAFIRYIKKHPPTEK